MTALFTTTGKLTNGQEIKVGDVVLARHYMYACITKVVEVDGILCLQSGPGAYCFTVGVKQFEKDGEVKKMNPVDIYKFCKENKWNTAKYLAFFK